MDLTRVADAHYLRSQATTRAVVAAVLALWQAAGPSGFRDHLVRAAGLVAAGQLTQAVQAAAYLTVVADAQALARPQAVVAPRAFAGRSADERPLVDVLSFASRRAWTMLDAGADYATANTSGMATVTRIVANEVTQAGVSAVSAGVVGYPDIGGYVRRLSPPSCGRCAILGGKWFQWNAGFARHPGCDCVHVPAAERGDVRDPKSYFDSLSVKDQDHYFGRAEAEAIRGGADVTRTVNATTKRQKRATSVPRSLDRLITGRSRGEAIDTLTRYGYLQAD